MINESIKNFIESLAEYHAENVFNPWADTNPDYEIENAVILRRRQLETYLSRRLSAAKLLLIAEACGYQGGHFTEVLQVERSESDNLSFTCSTSFSYVLLRLIRFCFSSTCSTSIVMNFRSCLLPAMRSAMPSNR